MNKIAFIGSGIIGSGLAVNSAIAGFPTYMQTRSQIDKMKERVGHIFDVFVENDVISNEEAEDAKARIVYTTNIKRAAENAAFIQESGPDKPEVKKELIAQIEAACPADTIIASSSTGNLPSEIQDGTLHPERIIIGHPYHPSYLLPLVEVCGSEKNPEKLIQKAVLFYESIGKLPIICRKEVRGAIINRLSWAAIAEASKTITDGICSVEDYDKALIFGPGMRMAITGQIQTISLGAEGGLRAMATKYGGEPRQGDLMMADGLEEAQSKRRPSQGKTEEEIADYRDKLIVGMLRMHEIL